jgi:hypothetical protein
MIEEGSVSADHLDDTGCEAAHIGHLLDLILPRDPVCDRRADGAADLGF